MGVKLWINKNHVFLSLCYNHRQWREALHITLSDIPAIRAEQMKVAETIRAHRELQIASDEYHIARPESKLTLFEFVQQYSQERGKESQIYKALPYLKQFGGDVVKLVDVDSRWFESFQEHIKHDSALKSAHTQEKYCCIVRQCLKKAVRDGLIKADPSEGIRHIRTPDSKKEFLTLEEVQTMAVTDYRSRGKMSDNLQNEIRSAYLFGCCTGLRISDLIQLKWGDIDRQHLRFAKRQQKTKNVVYIPVKESTLTLLPEGEHSPDTLIWEELAHTKTTTNRYLKKWAKAAGITKNVTWHTARHTDATLLLEYGADLYTVQRLLGHTKISTTAQYAKVSDRKSRQAVEQVPDIV